MDLEDGLINPFEDYPNLFEAAKAVDRWYKYYFTERYPGLFDEESQTIMLGVIPEETSTITPGRSDRLQFRYWYEGKFQTMVREWRLKWESTILGWRENSNTLIEISGDPENLSELLKDFIKFMVDKDGKT